MVLGFPSLREGREGRVYGLDLRLRIVNPHLNPPPQGEGRREGNSSVLRIKYRAFINNRVIQKHVLQNRAVQIGPL